MSTLAFRTFVPRPPHDPTWWLLDGRTGWRALLLQDTESVSPALETEPPLMRLAKKAGSGRALTESSGSFGGLTVPTNVTLGPDGDVYLVNGAARTLERFDPCACRFEVAPCFGGSGEGPRQLGEPCGLAYCDGDLFICDAGNHRVVDVTLRGFVIRRFWKPPTAAAPVPWRPYGIAFDSRGRAFVTDTANDCVHVFTRWGRYIRSISDLPAATDIAVDCHGLLYVIVGQSERSLSVLDADGTEQAAPQTRDDITARFPRLPFAVDQEGNLRLGSLCPAATRSDGLSFDIHGIPTEFIPDPPPQYVRSGTYITEPLDSHRYRCQWHRVVLSGTIPKATRVHVLTYASETEQPAELIQSLSDAEWSTTQTARNVTEEDWDCLVRSDPGRYLWLRLQLESDGLRTPALERVRVEYPRISLRRYLPAVFGQDPVSADFTDRFLGVFGTTLSGFERIIDTQSRLFDPMSTPADVDPDTGVDFLSWLASWIGLSFERHLSEPRRRRLLKMTAGLYAIRGTRRGMHEQLLTYLGVDRADASCRRTAPRTRCRSLVIPCGAPAKRESPWKPPPLILEHYKLRRWLFVGHGRIGEQAVLWGGRIVDRSRLGSSAQVGGTALKTSQDPLRDPFHVYAHQFSVFVPACYERSIPERRGLENLIATARPAHTSSQLIFVKPRFRIGVQSMIGLDAVVGRYPQGIRVGDATLGGTTVVDEPAHRRGGPTFAIGQEARVGTTTMLN